MGTTRVAVIGGGIAGVSVAHHLLQLDSDLDVVLLEMEATLAHHTTGRSAALLLENLGTSSMRVLTSASLDHLRNTSDDLVDAPLLAHRPVLHVGTVQQDAAMDRMLAEGIQSATTPTVEIDVDEAMRLFPLLRRERVHRAIVEPDSADIDVGGLHQSFVRGLRRAGGRIATSTRVDAATPDGDGWRLDTTDGPTGADVVVNCAGAWGDVVAATAGVAPVGLQPFRRTAFMVDGPGLDTTGWAFAGDIDHQWYLRDDGPQMFCSLAEENPSQPCDPKPEELDVALAIDRLNEATTLGIRSVNSAWVGLRTFAPDRSMVIGPDPGNASFVWCVGQGGTGIQTSPGAGLITAELTLGGPLSEPFTELDLDEIRPGRFQTGQ
ncbi:MAG: FAD-binding oxidoreductase [Actinomycetota bacterium]|nr:FAD-binding oxidoreductase [Actinomycetota bacterium]